MDDWNVPGYLRISDGAPVASGLDTAGGVVIFGPDGFGSTTVGDYVSATGVSSVWMPDTAGDAYRCVWVQPGGIVDLEVVPAAHSITSTGDVFGIVRLYDMPDTAANVTVFGPHSASIRLPIRKGQHVTVNSAGTAQYSQFSDSEIGSGEYRWTGVPKIDSSGTGLTYPTYLVSAQCPGYKTRTRTQVHPDSACDFYLTPLRKIYVTTEDPDIHDCADGLNTTSITATVRDAARQPVEGVTVRFKTDKGSFSASSTVRSCAAPNATNAQGQTTVTLYGIAYETGLGNVKATDDSAPHAIDSAGNDPFDFDWVQLHDSAGNPITVSITHPSVSLQLAPSSSTASVCENQKTLTATLSVGDVHPTGKTITFHTDNGTFQESGTATAQVQTDSAGVCAATLVRPQSCVAATAQVYATATSCDQNITSATVPVTWQSWKLEVKASPDWIVTNNSAGVTALLAVDSSGAAVAGQSVTLTTNHGAFDPHNTGNTQQYTATTDSAGTVSTVLTVGACPVTATVSGSTSTCGGNCTFSDSDTVRVVCSDSAARTVVFAVDMTGSMASGTDARSSIANFIGDLVQDGVLLRLGGVKFDNYVYDTKTLTADSDTFTDWLMLGYPDERGGGGDAYEAQLEALSTAAGLAPSGFGGLATDAGFHYAGDDNEVYPFIDHHGASCPYTSLTALQTRSILVSAGCRVYVDAGSAGAGAYYTTPYTVLHVDGAMEADSYGTYSFPTLGAAVRAQ